MSFTHDKTAVAHSLPKSQLSDSARTFIFLRDYDFQAKHAEMRKRARKYLEEVDANSEAAALDTHHTCW